MCGSVCKILIGLALLAAGIWMLIPQDLVNLTDITYIGGYAGVAWDAFLTVLLGTVPVLLILFGLLLVWIESEELKIQKPKKKKR